jgi:hypothetical protein
MEDILGNALSFVLEHKFWFIVAIPVVMAIMVIKARG